MKNLVQVLSITFMIFLSSCNNTSITDNIQQTETSEIQPADTTGASDINPGEISASETNAYDEALNALKVIINDDLWFWKEHSIFVDMLDKEVTVHVYIDQDDNHIYFFDYMTNLEIDKPFVAVKLIPFNESYSTSIEEVMYMSSQTELYNTIKQFGYRKSDSSTLSITNPVKPTYDNSNMNLTSIVPKIIEILAEDIRHRSGLPVTYNANIANFRTSDSVITVLMERDDGQLSYVVFRRDDELSFKTYQDYLNVGHIKMYHSTKSDYIIHEEEIHIEAPSFFSSKTPTISNYHPVLWGSQLILGSDKKNWYTIDDFITVDVPLDGSVQISNTMINGTETYEFYHDNELKAYLATNGLYAYKDEAVDDIKTNFNFEPNNPQGYYIGINCDWDPLPRQINEITPTHITIDIDGDDTAETLTITQKEDDPFEQTWELKISTISTTYTACIFQAPPNENGEPLVKLLSLDLNGDNRMELIVIPLGSAHSTTFIIECFDDHSNTLYTNSAGN